MKTKWHASPLYVLPETAASCRHSSPRRAAIAQPDPAASAPLRQRRASTTHSQSDAHRHPGGQLPLHGAFQAQGTARQQQDLVLEKQRGCFSPRQEVVETHCSSITPCPPTFVRLSGSAGSTNPVGWTWTLSRSLNWAPEVQVAVAGGCVCEGDSQARQRYIWWPIPAL